VDLRHGKRLLGSVPRQNLIRVRPGSVLRFAGRNWSVVRVEQRSIEVEPAPGRGHDVDVSYGGTGHGGLDAFLAQQLWQTLFSLTPDGGDLEAATWRSVEPFLTAVRTACGEGSLPCVRTPSGFRYYTFGGLLLNKVLAVWSGSNSIEVTDISVELDRALDLRTLPITLEACLRNRTARPSFSSNCRCRCS
jgi:ATP-dependent Lhr-like helicase